MSREPDPVGPPDIPLILLIPLDVYYGNILCQLSVEQVWSMRTVCKLYYRICMEYFRDRLHELVLNENAFLESTFGRTRIILARCERLQSLKIELLNCRKRDLSPLNVDCKVATLLSLLAESNCLIKLLVLRNIPLTSGFPSIASNLKTMEELVIDHVGCMQWSGVSKNIIGLKTRHDHLHSLTLNMDKYDGADLPRIADTCPNLRRLNVSYCSQLACDYLEAMFKKCTQLTTVHMCYVPSIKNRTILVLQEHCTCLEQLFVQGTSVSVDVLVSISSKQGVEIDVLKNELHLLKQKRYASKSLLVQT